MRLTAKYQLSNVEHFKKQACAWASQFKQAAVLLGNTDPLKVSIWNTICWWE